MNSVTNLPWSGELIAPFLACQLIALDIGDTARRIIAKATLSIIKPDIQEASGCIQLCGGQLSGIEAAVHAARRCLVSDDNEAILLADATNAFNSMNREVALQNIRRLCPALATILINTYREPTDLYVNGDRLLSQEGTTQGDPLAMPMYALASIPLINKLSNSNTTQIWYADDAAAAGKLSDLREWWDTLTKEGPAFGYYPNPQKTWLITKKGFHTIGSTIFHQTGVHERHTRWKTLPRITYRLPRVHGDLRRVQSCLLVLTGDKPCRHCHYPATRCLLCIKPWTIKQVDLYVSHNTQHESPTDTARGCTTQEPNPLPHG